MASGGGQQNATVVIGTSSSMEDYSSPYFFHSADHPSLVLVFHNLIGANYNTWSRVMLMALKAKNKISFIDENISHLAADDLLFGAWTRCNSMVISWILNFVARKIADSLLYIHIVSEVWEDLRDRFH